MTSVVEKRLSDLEEKSVRVDPLSLRLADGSRRGQCSNRLEAASRRATVMLAIQEDERL